jgi:hypothetical protein
VGMMAMLKHMQKLSLQSKRAEASD